ncbi:ETX/MTX2 family pore-forming toxin [Solirubrobacter ginsenosidimutans]|uniref:ETX/MTX2 family pore-forming toxin n=1 Tax=Solirubrobacter ginsenosidimutans TaxID=490573 RepID=A0A9X3N003_9ACTN|nr:ETX/MTX2 family pore-forming toxin [Solirubrobacter ginsenosidimutans]MDA0162338.1 ETX/MTX2 family pore-forming toxin [Solirubrobacter ginsenosidimutans]
MSPIHRIAGAVLCTAAFASITPAALALPPVGDDPIIHCPKGYVLVDDVCVKLPPPPPSISPVVTLGTPRQTVDTAAVRVTGRATDGDQPSAALTVQVRVDGVLVRTLTANQPDPPVATPNARAAAIPPPTLPGHTYDVTVPAPATAQTVCVTAVNVGSGSNTTVCRAVDQVAEFVGHSIGYDLDHLQITDASLESLDHLSQTNSSNLQQSTTMSGEKTFTDTQSWTNTSTLKMTLSGGVKIPLISDFKVSVEGSKSWTKNGSTTNTTKFAWSQPILVPAHSKIVASIAVTKTTLTVPYILSGEYVYRSGYSVAGTSGGTFTGVNSHDLEVTIDQFDLDGTPAAKPAPQPQASLLAGA